MFEKILFLHDFWLLQPEFSFQRIFFIRCNIISLSIDFYNKFSVVVALEDLFL